LEIAFETLILVIVKSKCPFWKLEQPIELIDNFENEK
jgi:hypothetical protein